MLPADSGSHPPSGEDVLQESSCSEHRSLTQSESDLPVDVYLPGNCPALRGCTAEGFVPYMYLGQSQHACSFLPWIL